MLETCIERLASSLAGDCQLNAANKMCPGMRTFPHLVIAAVGEVGQRPRNSNRSCDAQRAILIATVAFLLRVQAGRKRMQ